MIRENETESKGSDLSFDEWLDEAISKTGQWPMKNLFRVEEFEVESPVHYDEPVGIIKSNRGVNCA